MKGSLHFESKQDLEKEYVRIPIKSLQKKYSINSILASISKNLRKNFKRNFYREMGGVKMYLIKCDEK